MNKQTAEQSKRHLVVVDTSVLLADSEAIDNIISEEGNLLVIPLTVSKELDNKKDVSGLSSLARLAINKINSEIFSDSTRLIVERRMLFDELNLERDKHDYQILATFNYILHADEYAGYQKYELVTLDNNMRIIAYSLFKDNKLVSIEDYRANQIVPKKTNDLPVFSAITTDIAVKYDEKVFGEIPENSGVLIDTGPKPEENQGASNRVITIRKGKELKVIHSDLEVFGLNAHYHKAGQELTNYEQLLAFHQLTDPGIQCVFLHGPAGTGKTLLAVAAALQQRHEFEQLILVNPMVSLSDQQKLGFLPGDLNAKTEPWLVPFVQNIRFLERKCTKQMEQVISDKKNGGNNGNGNGNGNGNNGNAKKPKASFTDIREDLDNEKNLTIWEKYGFMFQPLEYIRGQTITGSYMIVEEAQNLSQHEMKTILTRAGEGTKIIFCGDLSQIDPPYINIRNSGLTYGIEKLTGMAEKNKMVAVCNLKITRRSKLAALASEMMA